jgi:hypothetical protein
LREKPYRGTTKHLFVCLNCRRHIVWVAGMLTWGAPNPIDCLPPWGVQELPRSGSRCPTKLKIVFASVCSGSPKRGSTKRSFERQ